MIVVKGGVSGFGPTLGKKSLVGQKLSKTKKLDGFGEIGMS